MALGNRLKYTAYQKQEISTIFVLKLKSFNRQKSTLFTVAMVVLHALRHVLRPRDDLCAMVVCGGNTILSVHLTITAAVVRHQ